MDWTRAFTLLDQLESLDPMDPEVKVVARAEMDAFCAELRYRRLTGKGHELSNEEADSE